MWWSRRRRTSDWASPCPQDGSAPRAFSWLTDVTAREHANPKTAMMTDVDNVLCLYVSLGSKLVEFSVSIIIVTKFTNEDSFYNFWKWLTSSSDAKSDAKFIKQIRQNQSAVCVFDLYKKKFSSLSVAVFLNWRINNEKKKKGKRTARMESRQPITRLCLARIFFATFVRGLENKKTRVQR